MRLPSYRRHSSGQARVTLNGRTYYLGPYGSKESKQSYDRIISEYLAGGRQLSFGVEPTQLTLVQCLADYLIWAKAHYGTGRNSEYHPTTYALRVVRSLYGDLPAHEFGSLQFKACREKLASELVQHNSNKKPNAIDNRASKKPVEKKPPRKHSRQYVNTQMKRILRVFKWLAAEGKFPTANFESMRLVAGLKAGKCKLPEAKRVVPVEHAFVDATIPHLPCGQRVIGGSSINLSRQIGKLISTAIVGDEAKVDRKTRAIRGVKFRGKDVLGFPVKTYLAGVDRILIEAPADDSRSLPFEEPDKSQRLSNASPLLNPLETSVASSDSQTCEFADASSASRTEPVYGEPTWVLTEAGYPVCNRQVCASGRRCPAD